MINYNKLSIINTVLILALSVSAIFIYLQKNDKGNLVYADNTRLFNGFNMTKDTKIIEEAKINQQIKTLDSLYSKFNALSKTELEQTLSKRLQQEIAYKSKALQELQDNYTYNLGQKVWSRLNAYVREYAEIKNLKIVFGANGNGNVLYAVESIDITNKLLEYANNKYEGN